MTATTITWDEYLAKADRCEINSHMIEVAGESWAISGFDGDDQHWAAELPFHGDEDSVRKTIRDLFGNDNITVHWTRDFRLFAR